MGYSLIKKKKLFILDMDGTFYLGNKVIEGSLEFIEKLGSAGKDFVFFTNNDSKNPEFYIQKLAGMGLRMEENIMTAGDVTIRYLLEKRKNCKVFLLGTEFLEKSFREAGIELVEEEPDAVVVGFDLTLTYEKVSRACGYIRKGAEFMATHMDLNCPTEEGFIPDCGSICAMITASVDVAPRYFGKPFKETVEMITSVTGYEKDDMIIIGDRLYTDIATGFKNGVASILVLSGETGEQSLAVSEIKPDYVFDSLGSIAEYI